VTPDVVLPPYLLAAVLLLVAGAVKLVRPRATAQALLDVGLPGGDTAARALGVIEVGAAVAALLAPASGGGLALAVCYLGFAGFLAHVLRRHPEAGSCGCAGATTVPPSRLHLVLNLLAGATGVATALAGPPPVTSWIAGLGAGAVVVLAGLALAGWLVVVSVTEAPAAFRAWAGSSHVGDHQAHGDDHLRSDEALAASGIGAGHASLWPDAAPTGEGAA
jgi:hypothetical protein